MCETRLRNVLLVSVGVTTTAFRSFAGVEEPPAPVFAQPVLSETSTVDDFVAYAAANNAGIRAAHERWQAAVERVPQAGALPDPELSYAYTVQEMEDDTGPQKHRFGLAQTFPWRGKRGLRAEVATQEAQAERARRDAVLWQLRADVTEAWHECAYQDRAVAVLAENKDLLRYLEQVLVSLYRVGIANHGDLVRVQIELGRLDNEIRSAQDVRRSLQAKLNTLLNRAPEEPLPALLHVSPRRVELPDEDVLEHVETKNPQLVAMAFDLAGAERMEALSRKEAYPDVTLGLEYELGGASRIAPRLDRGDEQEVMLSVAINLPIWRKRVQAVQRESLARRRAVGLERDEMRYRLQAAAEELLFRLRDAGRKAALYRDTLIPQTRQLLDVNEAALRTGRAPFLDLIDTERSLLEFQLALERAEADYQIALSRLEALAGSILGGLPAVPQADEVSQP